MLVIDRVVFIDLNNLDGCLVDSTSIISSTFIFWLSRLGGTKPKRSENNYIFTVTHHRSWILFHFTWLQLYGSLCWENWRLHLLPNTVGIAFTPSFNFSVGKYLYPLHYIHRNYGLCTQPAQTNTLERFSCVLRLTEETCRYSVW